MPRNNKKGPFPGHLCELPPPGAGRVYPTLAPDASLVQRAKRMALQLLGPWRRDRRFRVLHRSNFACEWEQARVARSAGWWVVHPLSRFQMGWHVFAIVLILVSVIYKPFVFSFVDVQMIAGIECSMSTTDAIMRDAVYVLDFLFAINILLKFNTGYFQPQNNALVMSRSSIAARYVKSWFVPDLISVFPIKEFFVNVVKRNSLDYSDFQSFPYKIFCSFTFLYQIPTFLRVCELSSRMRVVLYHYGTPDYIHRLIRTICVIFISAHWFSCAHFAIPLLTHGNNTFDSSSESWLSRVGLNNSSLCDWQWHYYMLSFCRMLSLTHGFGFVAPISFPDTVLFFANAWTGCAFIAYFLALFMNALQVGAESFITFEKIIQELKLYMRAKKLPLVMQRRILEYYNYQLQNSYFDEHAILASLPTPLKNDIKTYLCRRLVGNASIFKNIPKSLVLAIVRELKEAVYLRNDVVYRVGMPGKCMYFVSSGTLMEVLPSGEEIDHFDEGSHFGEAEMLHKGARRRTSVIALETCELQRLDRSVYFRLVARMPLLDKRLRTKAMTHEDMIITTTRLTEECHSKED